VADRAVAPVIHELVHGGFLIGCGDAYFIRNAYMIKNILSGDPTMRYAREQKTRTRQRVIASAGRLFAARGFAATSIDDIMRECGLTRGGFYAHFGSKSQLYREAMGHAGALDELPRDDGGCRGEGYVRGGMDAMLGACLDAERLAFFATDVASAEPQVRLGYTDAFKSMSAKIRSCSPAHAPVSEESVLSAAAMIVGSLAVARSTDDADLQRKLLASCRENARELLENRSHHGLPVLFWAPGAD
jgi:TetR/AcrR family transcriptional repressor of nem operon